MDGIPHDPTGGHSRLPAHPAPAFTVARAVVKTPSDYVRAVRRRVWLILAIAVPLSVGAALLVLRQPSVYRASAQIQIEPPEFDRILTTLVSRDIGHRDPDSAEKYVANKLALLRSKSLADEVVSAPEFAQSGPSGGDAGQDLLDSLQTRQVPSSSNFLVTLEGTDPERTAKLLYALLDKFREHARDETALLADRTKLHTTEKLNRLKGDLEKLNKRIEETLMASTFIGPGGKNLVEEQWQTLSTTMMHKHARLDDLRQQAWFAQLLPSGHGDPNQSIKQSMLADLEAQRRKLTKHLSSFRRTVRNYDTDPAVRKYSAMLDEILDEIEQIRSSPKAESAGDDVFESMIGALAQEIRTQEGAYKDLLARYRESAPAHQKFLNDLEERKQTNERISELLTKVSDFEILSKSQREAIVIPDSVIEPTVPVRPKRALNIALGLILSFGLGIGLVCALEHMDHTVKVPDQLSSSLALPLFGVVPRIRRTALMHRGGHLWTPGVPDSVEADAYRNLRASLLGATDRIGPIATLLVTSAKAGEGKSTTALNLAATCARAGERTLLMDVDLRRPSLSGVFDDDGHNVGLVDALRGDLPWQRTLVRTDLPNLDFLPTGDTRGIPVEVLGTLELRQLMIALSGHYDRVILDGPAVLGLADCRMLGRVVDAALLVVRAGSHGLPPLLRAKAMLEQSHVTLAGIVFNGLSEDLQNWSSYGPYEPYGPRSGRNGTAGYLDAPSDEPAALPAGSSEA